MPTEEHILNIVDEQFVFEFDGVLPGPPNQRRIGGVLLSQPGGTSPSTGDGKAYVRIPEDMDGLRLTAVGASCSTAGSSGATSVQLRRVRSGVGVDMLSTPVTIDANETDSSTAATAAVIDANNDDVQTGDQIFLDIDSVSTGARGLYVSFTFNE